MLFAARLDLAIGRTNLIHSSLSYLYCLQRLIGPK